MSILQNPLSRLGRGSNNTDSPRGLDIDTMQNSGTDTSTQRRMEPELQLLMDSARSAEEGHEHLILVVDDSPHNLDTLYETLKDDHNVRVARDGVKALELATAEPRPDLILLDVLMEGLSGYEVCERLKADPAVSDIPIIFITAKDDSTDEARGLALGAVDYITKPIIPEIVKARVETQLTLSDTQRALEKQVAERTRELEDSRMEVIRKLGMAAEFRDNESGQHIMRMSFYSQLIALRHTENKTWSELVLQAAPMHDIGKIGIPDNILQKPGRLNADEWEVMKKHAEIGAEIIGESSHPLFKTAREIALYHHEKWDGSGYPTGLSGEKIPLSARIVAVADVFDALTSERPYKKAWSVDEALEFLYENQGSHFDPQLVDLFLNSMDEVLRIRKRHRD